MDQTETKQDLSRDHLADEEKQERQKLAIHEKTKGNLLYTNNQFDQAIESYSKGLQYDPTNAVLLSNRAQAYIKLEKYPESETDCTLSLSYDPLNVKSYLRRATARFNLGQLDAAEVDLKRVLILEPNNKQAQDKLHLIQLIEKELLLQYPEDESLKPSTKDTQEQPPGDTVDISHTYGEHECQISEGEEADLHKLFNKCKKNPGHLDFIPIKQFKIDHLPADYRDQDLYNFIKVAADLTVRVSVNMVSPFRPQFFPNTHVQYPFFNKGGNASTRSGSGLISVYEYRDGLGCDARGSGSSQLTGDQLTTDYVSCPCEKCKQSGNASKVWWEIFVNTATHVVFDDIEASRTTCRLFFDDKDSPKVIIDKVTMDYVNIGKDNIRLKHVTCDTKLGPRLYDLVRRLFDLGNKVWNKFSQRTSDKVNLIVSHPHGCSKYVSIGRWVDNYRVEECDYNDKFDRTKFTYTTSTCPGSSGARIHCVGIGTGHVHNGAMHSKLNYSSVDLFRK
ncbi:RNA polymerase II-associated protein 3 [Biomphalaria glabrata]|nr:hypothetical protein BgiMline_017443 [Biomphalaria glabrata]